MEKGRTVNSKFTVVLVVVLAVICAIVLTACGTSKQKAELEIYAANSLKDAMTEAQEAYTKKNTEITFADTQFEGSQKLVAKMQAGGQPDIFISADKKNMNTVVSDGLVADDAPFDLFRNDLVIVTGENSDIDSVTLEDVASGKYTVALGVNKVPAGTYAKQALYTVGCYSNDTGVNGQITGKLKGKVTEAEDVGSVCSYAKSGDVQLGFVYSSDVVRYGGVKVVCTIPADTYTPIVYPAAVTKDAKSAEAAKKFLDWCKDDSEAQRIWQKWGFELA